MSFSCKLISNEVLTFHFKGLVISIIIVKHPSASVKPVIQKGLINLSVLLSFPVL